MKLPTSNVGRIALAIFPSSSSTLYAAIQDGPNATFGNLLRVWKSTDGGVNWSQLTIPDFCTPQCWYDLVVAVDPANASIVFAGGSAQNGTLYESPDGGATWSQVDNENGTSGVMLHVDHHAVAFASDGSKVYVGNDGGVWSSTNVSNPKANWTNLNAHSP